MACISGLGYSLLASVQYEADGSTSQFAFSFPFLNQDTYISAFGTADKSTYIRVFTRGGSGIWVEQTSGITMTDAASVTFATDPVAGTDVLIRRDSKRNQVKFDGTSGSQLDADRDLDMIYLHCLYLIQEQSDDSYLTDCRLDDQIAYAGNVYVKTGDASWTTFALTDGTTTEVDLSEKQIEVHINGTYQHESSYTVANVASVSTITLSTAPPTGYIVEARVIHSATVPISVLGNGTVTCDVLATGAICDLDKFDLDSLGTNKYVLGFLNPDTAFGIYQIDATWINGFNASVQLNRLDQMDAPTGSVDMNSQKIINVLTPSSANDAANKAYVDAQVLATTTPHIDTQSVSIATAGVGQTLNAGFDYDSVNVQLRTTGGYYPTTLPLLLTYLPYVNRTYFASEIAAFTQFFFAPSYAFSLQKIGNTLVVGSNVGGNQVQLICTFIKDG